MKELSQTLEERKKVKKSCLTCDFEPQNIDEKCVIKSCYNHSEWIPKKLNKRENK